MKAGGLVVVFVLAMGMLYVTPVVAARPVSPDCPPPVGPSLAGASPQCGGGCTPTLVTVTARIFEAKAEIDLDGIYLADGQSSQYAAGCGEAFAISVYQPAAGYSFWQWEANVGSFANPDANPTWYTPSAGCTSCAVVTLIPGTGDSQVGSLWYGAGYRATGSFNRVQTAVQLPSSVSFISSYVGYDAVFFEAGIGTPSSHSVAGVFIKDNANVITLGTFWTTSYPGDVLTYPLPNIALGQSITITVTYDSSTGDSNFYVCNYYTCNSNSYAYTPDLSMAFIGVEDPCAVVDFFQGWVQVPTLPTASFAGTIPSFMDSPANQVVGVFPDCSTVPGGYSCNEFDPSCVVTATPGYAATDTSSDHSSFPVSFTYSGC